MARFFPFRQPESRQNDVFAGAKSKIKPILPFHLAGTLHAAWQSPTWQEKSSPARYAARDRVRPHAARERASRGKKNPLQLGAPHVTWPGPMRQEPSPTRPRRGAFSLRPLRRVRLWEAKICPAAGSEKLRRARLCEAQYSGRLPGCVRWPIAMNKSPHATAAIRNNPLITDGGMFLPPPIRKSLLSADGENQLQSIYVANI